jgi:hypothetical protein
MLFMKNSNFSKYCSLMFFSQFFKSLTCPSLMFFSGRFYLILQPYDHQFLSRAFTFLN